MKITLFQLETHPQISGVEKREVTRTEVIFKEIYKNSKINNKDYIANMFIENNGKLFITTRANRDIVWCDYNSRYYIGIDVINNMIEAIISTNPFITGKIYKDPFTTVEVWDNMKSKQTYYANKSIIPSNYIPAKSGNFYININNSELVNAYNKGKQYFNLPLLRYHEADNHNPYYSEICNRYEEYSKKLKPSRFATILSKVTNGKSFGLEYEVSTGTIHSFNLIELGLIPLQDGSVSREYFGEYATAIMHKPQDFDTIIEQCKHLTQQCNVDSRCAFHIHIGNVKKDKITVAALYALSKRIQDEMYDIMHPYKRNEVASLNKEKDYSSPLPTIDFGVMKTLYKNVDRETFKEVSNFGISKIWEVLSTKKQQDKLYNRKYHKKTPWNRKWECPTRYYWLNMINMFFSNSGTVEFRLHTPTVSVYRVIPWILICNAIVRYAETYQDRILKGKEKITLEDILIEYGTNFGQFKKRRVSKLLKIRDFILGYVQIQKAVISDINQHINRKMVGGNTGRKWNIVGENATDFIKGENRFIYPELDNLINEL